MERFPVLVCSACKKAQELGNYCGQCGARLEEVTVTPEMIHERTIPEWNGGIRGGTMSADKVST